MPLRFKSPVDLAAVLRFIKGPIVLGLLIALLALQLFPELNPRDQGQVSQPSFTPHSQTSSYRNGISYADAVSKASPAVVNIYTRTKVQRKLPRIFDDPLYRYFYESADIPRQERMQSALGSGVIISENGYLLTNNHVISGADEIIVQLQDGRESRAQFIGADMENDLAVLHIGLSDLNAIAIPSHHQTRVGDVVLAIGNPFGMGQTVTQGIISATQRHGLGISTFENFIQTDAAINPGNSGGALIDSDGNFLGINTAILETYGNSELDGVGLAVPADTAVRVFEDIVKYGKVVRGWLGVEAQNLTQQLAKSFQLDSASGVLITRIYNDGPAHEAGLQPGDVITRINGETVGDGSRSRQQIAESRPGETVDIEFFRNGKLNTVSAVLTEKPTDN